MFSYLGSLCVRRARLVLAVYGVAVIAAFAGSSGVFGQLKTQGYDNPASASARVDAILVDDFSVETPSVVMIVDTTQGVDNPAIVSNVGSLTDRISAEPEVTRVISAVAKGDLLQTVPLEVDDPFFARIPKLLRLEVPEGGHRAAVDPDA